MADLHRCLWWLNDVRVKPCSEPVIDLFLHDRQLFFSTALLDIFILDCFFGDDR